MTPLHGGVIFRKYEEADEAIKGLDLAFKLVGGAESRGRHREDLVNDIKEVALMFEGEWTGSDMLKKLAEERPEQKAKRSSVLGVLKVLTEQGVIELIERGQGRKPSKYRVPLPSERMRLMAQ